MLNIDCKEETDKIVEFIQDTFKEKRFEKAIVGVSGGLDSAVIVTLLVKALGKDNVCGFYMPIETPKDFTGDAYVVSDKFKIHMDTYAIKLFIEMFKTTFPDLKSIDLFMAEKIRIGNLMARTRMMILYDMSAKYSALVVGTSNKTELTLGYFTLHGDGACALEPIGHLYKTQVKQLAEYLEVPKQIIEKAPSAELWEDQTDEEELGMTYEKMDKILSIIMSPQYRYCDKQETIDLLGYKELREKVEKLIEKNRFKSESPGIIIE